MHTLTITVKTLFGFEEILKEEIEALGFKDLKVLNRAVQLTGSWKDVYTLNFRCRLAISVLVKVEEFYVNDEDDLYKKAKRIDWTSFFDVDKTFAVKGAVFSTLFNHTMYPFLVVKDAIVDAFRDKVGERPNVNSKSPQVMFDVYIKEKQVVISLNTSGVPLFQRGYRQETGEAPMNEVLAAGLLKLSKWDAKSTFIDPMCGSGTLVIEAALLAADIPSMIERQHYAFKNFKSFDEKSWEEVQAGVNRRPVKLDFPIIASDEDGVVLQKAKRNAKAAPIGNMVSFDIKDVKDIEVSAEKGTLICNPPYGERIGDHIEELYELLGDTFKQKLPGFDCWIVTSNMDAVKHVGLKPDKKYKVFNGSLECTFRKYSIFEGSKKAKYIDLDDEAKVDTKHALRREDKKKSRIVSKPVNLPERNWEETELEQEQQNTQERQDTHDTQEQQQPYQPKTDSSRYNQPKSKYLMRSNDEEESEEGTYDHESEHEHEHEHEDEHEHEREESVIEPDNTQDIEEIPDDSSRESTTKGKIVRTKSKLDSLKRNRK